MSRKISRERLLRLAKLLLPNGRWKGIAMPLTWLRQAAGASGLDRTGKMPRPRGPGFFQRPLADGALRKRFRSRRTGNKKGRLVRDALKPRAGCGRGATRPRTVTRLSRRPAALHPLKSGSAAASPPRGAHAVDRHVRDHFQASPQSHGRDPQAGSGARKSGRQSPDKALRAPPHSPRGGPEPRIVRVFSFVSIERSGAAK